MAHGVAARVADQMEMESINEKTRQDAEAALDAATQAQEGNGIYPWVDCLEARPITGLRRYMKLSSQGHHRTESNANASAPSNLNFLDPL